MESGQGVISPATSFCPVTVFTMHSSHTLFLSSKSRYRLLFLVGFLRCALLVDNRIDLRILVIARQHVRNTSNKESTRCSLVSDDMGCVTFELSLGLGAHMI
jgi:hypothetical protein